MLTDQLFIFAIMIYMIMLERIETELFNDFTEAYDKFLKETATYDSLLSFFYIFT